MAIGSKIVMKVFSIAVGIPVGIVTKKAVERVWTAARPNDPPRAVSDPNTRWQDAMGWAAVSAAGVVAADVLTRRGAEATWRKVVGTEPPPPKPTKEQKKLAKAEAKAEAEANR